MSAPVNWSEVFRAAARTVQPAPMRRAEWVWILAAIALALYAAL